MDDYVDSVRQSYDGEVVAEGFYRQLAGVAPEGHRRDALSLIADVEGATHRRLAPLAAELGIELSQEARDRRIQHRLQDLGPFDWDEFIRRANREWPRYLEKFRQIELAAQARGETRLQFLVAHEQALVEFVRLEFADPGSPAALGPLESYLASERSAERA